MEFAGFFEVFEGLEVFPVGEVLYGGDAVGESVGYGNFEGPAALFRGGWRDLCADEDEGGGFADDSGGFALCVVIDLTAGRVGGCGGDAGDGEGGRVDHGDVLVGAGEDGGMTCGDGINVGAVGKLLVGPDGVVPASAADPCSGGESGGEGANALLHLGEGGDMVEVDGELIAAGVGDVSVGVVEAGRCEGVV